MIPRHPAAAFGMLQRRGAAMTEYPMLREIVLHGSLRKRFGASFCLDVILPAQWRF